MSLDPLNWKQLPVQSGMTALVPNLIDAINTAFKSNVYIDGSARVTGSGVAWTPVIEKYGATTEACYFTPPSSSLGQRIIVAGSSRTSGLAPTMASPDTYAANFLFCSLQKNVDTGSYSSWTNSSPFSNGDFFGYWKFWSTSMGGALSIRAYESADGIAIFVHCNSDVVTGFIAGAIIDCETSNTSSDSEIDNKVYGILTTGANSTNGKFQTTSNTSFATAFLGHNNSNGSNHSGIFVPNDSTIKSILKQNLFSYSDSTTLFTKSNSLVKLPIFMCSSTSPYYFVGRLREIWYFRDAIFGNSVTDGVVVNGYLVSGGTNNVADSIMFST